MEGANNNYETTSGDTRENYLTTRQQAIQEISSGARTAANAEETTLMANYTTGISERNAARSAAEAARHDAEIHDQEYQRQRQRRQERFRRFGGRLTTGLRMGIGGTLETLGGYLPGGGGGGGGRR